MLISDSQSAHFTLGDNHEPFKGKDAGKAPSSQHAASDFEMIDAGADSDVINKFTTHHQYDCQYKHCLFLVGITTLKVKDQLQLEMLTPPPEELTFIS